MSDTLERLLPICGMLATLTATVLSSACSSNNQNMDSSGLTEPATNSQAISAGDASMPVLLADAAAPETPPWAGQGQCAAVQVEVSRADVVGCPVECEVLLNGRFRGGDLCRASVELNGVTLECMGDNGWRLKDDQIVELTGDACERFKSDPAAQVTLDFPCDLIDFD